MKKKMKKQTNKKTTKNNDYHSLIIMLCKTSLFFTFITDNCISGECECYDPYAGSDCSVDKQTPPEMFGLLDDGLCDERDMPCTDAHFFAYPLIDSSTLTCHISTYSVSLVFLRCYYQVKR